MVLLVDHGCFWLPVSKKLMISVFSPWKVFSSGNL
jgi:hypothetical protein